MDHFIKMRKKVSIAESTRQVLNKCIDLIHRVKGGKIDVEEAKEEITAALSTFFISNSDASGGIREKEKLQLEIVIQRASEVIDKVSNGDMQAHDGIMFMNKIVAFRGADHMLEEQMEDMQETRSLRPTAKKREMTEKEKSLSEKQKGKKIHKIEPSSSALDRDIPRPQFERTREQEEAAALEPSAVVDASADTEGMMARMKREIREELNQQKAKAEVSAPVYTDETAQLMDEVLEAKKQLERSIIKLNKSLSTHGFELKPVEPK